MNNKFGTTLSTALIILGIVIWSSTVLAAEPVSAETPAADISIGDAATRLAMSANVEAADEAARSIQMDAEVDLDIRLVGPASVRLAAE